MRSHRINQVYPLVRLAIYEIPSDVVLDILSRSIRSLPLSSNLFRSCTSNSVETGQWSARDGSREAANLGWYDVWKSLHGCSLGGEGVWKRGWSNDVRQFCGERARSNRHVIYGAYGLVFGRQPRWATEPRARICTHVNEGRGLSLFRREVRLVCLKNSFRQLLSVAIVTLCKWVSAG